MLLVIEDGHWADTPTLLLRHLARAPADARIMVLTTVRDTETEASAQLADAVADLRRTGEAVRLHLSGLPVEDVADFLAASTPRGVSSPTLAVMLRAISPVAMPSCSARCGGRSSKRARSRWTEKGFG